MTQKTVLLVHGLAESSTAMTVLAANLRMQGYNVVSFDYPSTRHSIEECTALYLDPAIRALSTEGTFSIVTHSMGGIMVRYYLQNHKIENLDRVVMLVPGHRGSRTMTAMKKHPLFPMVMGPAGVQSGDDEELFDLGSEPFQGAELGIVAGCLSFDVIGSTVMKWPHDGKLKVDSTILNGMKDHIVLPVSHDSVLFDPLALYQTSHFLKHGSFLHLGHLQSLQVA